jgi:hypothetical protein
MLPEKYRAGIKEYKILIGIDSYANSEAVGGSNSGVASYNTHLLKKE